MRKAVTYYKCLNCGKECNYRYHRRLFCSRACHREYVLSKTLPPRLRHCKDCGKEFMREYLSDRYCGECRSKREQLKAIKSPKKKILPPLSIHTFRVTLEKRDVLTIEVEANSGNHACQLAWQKLPEGVNPKDYVIRSSYRVDE